MANRHRVRVLVVDDEEDTCRNFSDILTDLGDRVGRACDGETAPELVRRQPSDVVLPDLTLPGIDGLTLSREFRAAPIALNLPGSHGTEVLDLVRQPRPETRTVLDHRPALRAGRDRGTNACRRSRHVLRRAV